MGPEPVWNPTGPGAVSNLEWNRLAECPGPRTTLHILAGQAVYREAHLRRLKVALASLGSSCDWLDAAFQAALAGAADGILRLRLLPGSAVLLHRLEPWRPAPTPYRLVPLRHPLGDLRENQAARHKGLLGNWSAAALALARAHGADDVLCLWPDGTLAETAIASIALIDPESLRVPPPAGRVASIAEGEELPRWAAAHGLSLHQAPIPLAEIAGSRLLCFNAVRGVWHAEILPPSEP